MSTYQVVPLLFLCLLGLAGCSGTAPNGLGRSPEGAGRPTPDSTQPGSRQQASRSAAPGVERKGRLGAASEQHGVMRALRAAYVDGAYEEIVRRVHTLRQDSLSPSTVAEMNMVLGRAEQARGRHEAAIQALRRARVAASDLNRSLGSIDRALGESYVARYWWPQAASAFRRVLDATPRDRAARRALAEVYRRSRQWSEAREQYARLVRADSSNGRWWARLAQCSLELNATDRALRHFATAHRHLPQSSDVALSLSRLYRAKGRPGAARRVVDITLSKQPGDPRLWRRQADLAFEQDDLDTARRAYTRTIATGDSSATAYRRIGLINVRQQKYAQALSPLRESFQRDSTHARTSLYLGVAYLKLDSLQRATTYLQRTVDQRVQGPLTRALEQLGTTYSQRGDVTYAVRVYKTALRLQPTRSVLYFHLATVYDEHYRDKSPAARYYHRFLQRVDAPLLELRRYAESRLETLRPTLHMQGARSKDR